MAMYTGKEKICLANRLHATSMAGRDLDLLKLKAPNSSDYSRYDRNPSHYADDILYALLDVATAEEIVANRRKKEAPVDDTEKKPVGKKAPAKKAEAGSKKKNQSKKK